MNPILLYRPIDQSVIFTAATCTTFNMTMAYVGRINVDWGDGNVTTIDSTNGTVNRVFNHTYLSPYTGSVKINGNTNRVTYFQSNSNTGITGYMSEINKFKNLAILSLFGNMYLTCTTSQLNRSLTHSITLNTMPNLIISGSFSDMPPVINTFILAYLPQANFSGLITDVNSVTISFIISYVANINQTIDVADIARVTSQLSLEGLPNLILTGDYGQMPLSQIQYAQGVHATSTLTYTAGSLTPPIKQYSAMYSIVKFTTAQTDNILIDNATHSLTFTGGVKTILLRSLGRTSASDAAVATLNTRGATISLV